MNLVLRKIEELRPAEYNPRKPLTKKKMDQLKKSLELDRDFFNLRPLLINTYPGREGVIIGGNQRYLAAKELGWKHVPCLEVKADLRKEKKWNLKDNKEYGEWEFSGLADILGELDDGSDDMETTGFLNEEIESIMTWNKPVEDDELPDVDIKGNVEGKSFYLIFSFKDEREYQTAFDALGSDRKFKGDNKRLFEMLKNEIQNRNTIV